MLVDEFCNKYCKPFCIFHFIYIEIFYSGRVDVITNNRRYLQIYIEKQFPFSSELNLMIDTSPLNADLLFLWPKKVDEQLPLMLDALCICNGITLFEKSEDSLKTIAFATDQFHDNLVNFYINNLQTLKKIKNQFLFEYEREDFYPKETFFIPPVIKSTANTLLTSGDVPFDNILKINGKIFSISDSKMQILIQLAKGKTLKETAFELNISTRTVEKQLELLMVETDIHSKSLLIQAFNDSQ